MSDSIPINLAAYPKIAQLFVIQNAKISLQVPFLSLEDISS